MGDQRYVLPRPPTPWHQRLTAERCFSIAALFASVAAAAFTGWYAWDTHGMRLDAQAAAQRQIDDVKLAREASQRSADAAERSARAADKLADAMKESASAARQSAEAGRQSLEVSRQALQVNQAPALSIAEAKLELPLIADKPPKIQIVLLNAGKGPATNIHYKVWLRVGRMGEPRMFDYPYTSETRLPTLAADATYSPEFGLHPIFESGLNAQIIDFLKSHTHVLYFYGVIVYGETIDLKRTYSLNWCYEYAPEKPNPEKLAICQTHNETIIR